MSLWLAVKAQRSAGAAILVSVVMHAFALAALILNSTDKQTALDLEKQSLRPPLQVVFLTDTGATAGAMVTKLVPQPTTHLSADSTRQHLATQASASASASASALTEQATGRHEVRAEETRPVGDPAQVDGRAPGLANSPSKLAAGVAEPNRGVAQPAQSARPDYAYNPQPDYPMLLREHGVGGVVWLRVWVDSEGQPAQIQLAKGSGYRLLDDAAMRAVKHWRFIPAQHGEQRLASWVEFPIRFSLNG